MHTFEKWYDAVLMLEMFAEFVTTPEQRAAGARQADWEYHASRYTDLRALCAASLRPVSCTEEQSHRTARRHLACGRYCV